MERDPQFIQRVQDRLTPYRLKIICYRMFGLSDSAVLTKRQEIRAKHFTAYTLKYFYEYLSLKMIASLVDLDNHATIIYIVRKMNDQFEVESRYQKHYKTDTITWKQLLVRINKEVTDEELREVEEINRLSKTVKVYNELFS